MSNARGGLASSPADSPRFARLEASADGGVVLLNAVGAGAMLAVVLGDPAVLGKVRYHVKKALPDLVRAV